MKTWSAAALAILMSIPAGCGRHPIVDPAAGCVVDADCTGEQVCKEAICAVVETSPRELGFQLIPSGDTSYPPQIVPVAPLRLSEPLTIGIEPGIRVAGSIELTGKQGQANGQLKFKQRASRNAFVGEARVEQSAYAIFVPAGSYDVTFFPDDPELPTRLWREVAIELDTDPMFRVNAQTVPIVGTLSRSDLTSEESTRVEGARVFAVSRDTGSVSSTSVTNDAGEFTINVLQDSGIYDLHVAPASPNRYAIGEAATDYVPDVSYLGAFAVEGAQWSNLVDPNPDARPLSVSLGEYGSSPLEFRFRLQSAVEGNDIDWTGTSVTLQTEAGHGILTIRQPVDPAGGFEIPLFLGTYTLDIRTPPGLPVASAHVEGLEISLDSLQSVLSLSIEPRIEATGTVTDSSGSPLANAQLTFAPRDADSVAEPLNVVTHDDGTFAAWLDDVRYRVTVVPADPGLPRHVLGWSSAEPDLGEVRLAEPALAWGQVLGTPSGGDDSSEWRDVPDVVVRAFELSAEGEIVVVGEAKTDSDGAFRIVLPARGRDSAF